MPFEWYQPNLSVALEKLGRQRLEADLREEAEYRARLYHTLGFSRDEALTRIAQNVRWEWELHTRPRNTDQFVRDAVTRVYGASDTGAKRARPRSSPPGKRPKTH